MGTAEDLPFHLLHAQLVSEVLQQENKTETEASLARLELMGYNTGYRFVEKLTREAPKFKEELDLMKFVCKDLWMAVFKKQIDNLRTNHQGVYVLLDNSFRFLQPCSGGRQYLEDAPKFVVFTCGLVRGSLANLGVTSVVTAEVTKSPAVKLQVLVQRS